MHPALAAQLDRVARALVGAGKLPASVDARARELAFALFEAHGGRADAERPALLGFAVSLLYAIAVDLAADPVRTDRMITQLEALGLSRRAVALEAVRAAQLPEMPAEVAIEVLLTLLRSLSRARYVSLWLEVPGAAPRQLSAAGDLDHVRASAAARAVLAGEPGRAGASSVRIERLDLPAAGLVGEGGGDLALLLDIAAQAFASLIDRHELARGGGAPPAPPAGAVERALARLRFDLHDGPQQDVHLLASDLALFRDQLEPIIEGDPNAARVRGRIDDLAAQLEALDGDLRRLSASVQSPFLFAGPLPEALRQVTDGFTARTGIRPAVQLSGDLTGLTDSQQIALLSLVREALSNVRKHSDARRVTIRIGAGADGVEAEVTDDGAGFDPETTLVRAAREGRLGLVGMHERMRMLGGETRIDSRPGGPTVISVTLPAWPAREAGLD